MRHLRNTTDPFRQPLQKFKNLYRLPPECVLSLLNLLESEELRFGTIPGHLKAIFLSMLR